MTTRRNLDCVVIGYNDLPFGRYESLLRSYGENSEAYRDLKFSFIDLQGEKLNYVDLLNRASGLAHNGQKSNGRGEFESGDIPNLAAAYLTWFLRRRGLEAKYINLFQLEKEKLKEYLADNPYCVAITTTFYVLNSPVNEMVEFIRSQNPDVKIVVGGPLILNHIRNYQGERLKAVLRDMGADYYVLDSQGETTLWQIVECLRNKGDISTVPNLIYFDDAEIVRTQVVLENNSLDENYVNWTGFPDERLGPTIQTRTARSCAFKCSFCNYPTRAGALTLTSLDVLEKELDSMLGLGDVKNVVFIDDTFNVPFPRFKEICRLMIRRKYNFNWFSYFRCSNSDEEAFDLMAESGCKGVFLGIESGSPSILVNMNKAATVEKYAKGIRALHERGILTFGSFILGFPGETAATIKETTDFIKENKPTYYRTQMWYCEPGTPIDGERKRFGIAGKGFMWKHATMDSMEAMKQIENMFLSIKESEWLPQWSFDFWIIPYLLGKNISLERFKDFMSSANKMLEMEIAGTPEQEKFALQGKYKQQMVDALRP